MVEVPKGHRKDHAQAIVGLGVSFRPTGKLSNLGRATIGLVFSQRSWIRRVFWAAPVEIRNHALGRFGRFYSVAEDDFMSVNPTAIDALISVAVRPHTSACQRNTSKKSAGT